jgi:hypothetical protein
MDQKQEYTEPEKAIALDPIDPKDVQQKQEQTADKQTQEQKQ